MIQKRSDYVREKQKRITDEKWRAEEEAQRTVEAAKEARQKTEEEEYQRRLKAAVHNMGFTLRENWPERYRELIDETIEFARQQGRNCSLEYSPKDVQEWPLENVWAAVERERPGPAGTR